MRIFYTDHFVLPLPEGHRFPMRKYALLRQRVAESGIVAPEQLLVPHAATDAELLRAHDVEYLRRCQAGALTPQEIRRIGFPWSPAMVERSRDDRSLPRRAARWPGRQPGRRHAPRLCRSRRGLLRVQR
jgi:acetoin utilization deacetylase AcuC-like enzyme